MKTVHLLLGGLLAGLPSSAGAQMLPPSGQAPPPEPAAVQACVACHGARGAGEPAGNIPRIAGLSYYYALKQLESYAVGTRRNPEMEEIVRTMTPQEMEYVAAYFAQVDAPAVPGGGVVVSARAAGQGRMLATVGSNALRLQACENCHGPDGGGQPPNIPYLAGQGANYLIATLNDWRTGARRNDEGAQMSYIAQALTPEAIVAVARYYSSLPPPPPRPVGLVRPPPSAARAAAPPAGAAPPAAREVTVAVPDLDRLSPVDLSAADPARGRAILSSGAYGCAGCHTIPGVRRANGVVGPTLEGFRSRAFIAGQLPNRPDVLVSFLIAPPALVPRTGMPATGLSPEEAQQIAAYLYTLER